MKKKAILLFITINFFCTVFGQKINFYSDDFRKAYHYMNQSEVEIVSDDFFIKAFRCKGFFKKIDTIVKKLTPLHDSILAKNPNLEIQVRTVIENGINKIVVFNDGSFKYKKYFYAPNCDLFTFYIKQIPKKKRFKATPYSLYNLGCKKALKIFR